MTTALRLETSKRSEALRSALKRTAGLSDDITLVTVRVDDFRRFWWTRVAEGRVRNLSKTNPVEHHEEASNGCQCPGLT